MFKTIGITEIYWIVLLLGMITLTGLGLYFLLRRKKRRGY